MKKSKTQINELRREVERRWEEAEVKYPIDSTGNFNQKAPYCFNCGANIKDQKYCHGCGRKLNWQTLKGGERWDNAHTVKKN